jgi:hypothetical protein
MTVALRICLALSLLSLMGSVAIVEDPALAPGRDPGGTAIAIVAEGFDYQNPRIQSVLARDGEGEVIAGDAVDRDHRPYSVDTMGNEILLRATAQGGVRIVMVRVAWDSPDSLRRGVFFSARTPARIVLVPLTAEMRGHLVLLNSLAEGAEQSLFIANVPAITAEEKTMSDTVTNLVLLDSEDNELIAAEAVARVLGCGQPALTGATGAELKTAFLARLQAPAVTACDPNEPAKSK